MTAALDLSCDRCRWAFESECRRFPPTATIVMIPQKVVTSAVPSMVPQPLSTFPAVSSDTYCGEYSPRLSS